MPFIKFAEEGKWYLQVDSETLARLHGLEDSGLSPGKLTAIENAAPYKQTIPWVHCGYALRTTPAVKAIPCQSPDHSAAAPAKEPACLSDTEDFDLVDDARVTQPSRQRCKRCAKVKEAALRKCDLIYVNIVKTTQDSPVLTIPPPPGSPAAGLQSTRPSGEADIYKIVKVGGRDAAASQAFYDAGANGHSTVFTLVTRADVDWSILAEAGVKRVDELWQLTEDTDGPIPVFF